MASSLPSVMEALDFLQALGKCYPDTVHQRCWMHKTANVLAALPKSVHPKDAQHEHRCWMSQMGMPPDRLIHQI